MWQHLLTLYLYYIKESGGEGRQQLTAARVLQILKNITDQDIRDMGLSEEFARPEWMIITVLPVPPPQVRPSIQMDGTSRGEDDLTHKLSDVLKANANVKRCESEGAPVHVVQEFEQLLQVCFIYININAWWMINNGN